MSFVVHALPGLAPISRDTMRSLKVQKEEAERLNKLSQIVQGIYHTAKIHAETKEETTYSHVISPEYNARAARCAGARNPEQEQNNFVIQNMPDIIQALESLFPGCSVEHKTMAMNPVDRKLHDISKMDATARSFIHGAMLFETIVIDWS